MDYRIAGQCRRAGIACALTAALLIPAQRADAANGNWLGTTNSTWATTTNWSGASAPTTNELATFNGTGNGSTTINLGSGVTLRSLVFNTSSAAAYTIGSGAVGSQTLTLNVAAWANEQGGITVNSTVTNNQLFNANVVLGDASAYGHYIINNSTAATLTLAGNVTGGTGGTVGAKTLYLGGAGNTTISGTIARGGATSLALNKTGAGTLTLSGNNSYTGTTTINQGTVNLDFSAATAPTTNIISATPALSLTGGTLRLDGKASTVNSQAVASTTVGAGNSAVALNLNSATSLLLDLKAITRSAGGTLNLSLPTGTQSSTNGVITTTTNLTNGVLVSAASNGIAYATVGGTDWAGLSSGNIVAMSTYQTGNGNYTTNNNLDVTNGDSVSGVTVNTLRFNGNNALTLSGNNTVNTGGVLVTSAASTGASISGGTLRSGGGKELVLINNGAQFTVGSDIADNATASALTISGPGTTTLSGTNTYTGATYINGGTVKAGSSQALGVNSNVTLSNNAASILNLNGNNLTIGGLNATGVLVQPISPTNYGTMDLSAASVALGSNTLTVGAGNASSTFGGSITGTGGSLVKIGTGGLTLNGNNTFTGGITIKAGSVTANGYLNGGATFGSGGQNTLGNGTITLGDASGGSAAATLRVGGLANSVMTYTNALVLTGTNALTLTQPNSNLVTSFNGNVTGTNSLIVTNAGGAFYTNGNFNNSGNLSFTAVDSINGGIGANVQNVTIVNGRSGLTLQINAGINNTGTFTHSNTSGTKTQLGSIGSNVTALINTAGTLELSGVNTFTGNTTLNGGTLVLMDNSALQMSGLDTSGAGVINATSRTAPTFGGLIGSKDIASVITTGYASITALTLNPQSGRSYTYSGNITNGAANMNLIKNGSGTQILSGTNTYSGNTTVSAGLLTITSNSSLPGLTTNGRYSVASGATLGVYNAVTDADIASMVATTNFQAGAAIGFDTTTANRTYSSNLTNTSNGTLGLTKLGSNTLTLSGTNTYNGSTTIAAGTLSVSSIGNNGSSSNVGSGSAINIGSFSSTGTLLYTGAAQTTNRTIVLSGTTGGAVIDQSGSSGLVKFSSNIAATGSGNKTLTLQGSTGGTGELSGVISDFAANTATTALVKAGTGTWTLSGTNTYTGGTTLSAGILGINATAALGTSGNITFSGGTMQFASGGSGADYGARIKNSASAIILDTDGQSVTFAGAMDSSNTLGLTKNGTGTLSLSAANSYTGTTTVNAGTLALGSNLALQNSTLDTSGAGCITLAGGITTPTLGGLSGSKDLSSGITGNYNLVTAITLNPGANQTVTYSGNITNGAADMSLTKSGAGTQILSGANTYTGATTVNAGTLRLGASNVLADTSNLTIIGGTFDISTYSDTVGVITMTNGNLIGTSGVLTGSTYNITGGNLTAQLGGGSVIINNGTTNVSAIGSAVTFTVDGSSAVAALTANVVASSVSLLNGGSITGSFSLNASGGVSSNSGSIASSLIGSGGVTMNGAGNTLALSGSNSYTGATTISAGTLSINAAAALGSTSGVNLANGTALLYTGGAGTLGSNITVSSGTGTLRNSGGATLTLGGSLSKNGTTLTFGQGAFNVTGSITGSAANSDLVVDAAELTLNGANTYNGPTYIINSGTLNANASGALPTSTLSAVTINGSSTLALGASQSVASLSGTSGSTVNLNANTLTVNGSATSTYSGGISGTGHLVKNGSGTQTLAGATTFTGSTTVNSGTLTAASANALGNSTVINVNGGSFLVTAENAVNDSANINLAGGRMAVSGNFNQNVGALTLSADSIIDFSAFSGILRFSGLSWASGASNATLAIWNWSGTTEWGTQVNNYTNPSNLVFSNSANLTADNLAKISFYSDSGDSFVGKGFIESDFAGPGTLIVAVPEPETYLTGVLLILGATVQYLRHRAKRKALYGHRPS